MENNEKKLSPFLTTPVIALVIVTGLALWVFLVFFNRMPVWGDEYFTFKVSSFPILDTIFATLADTHPPFYWILTNTIMSIFDGDIVPLRLFSVLCGILAILFTALTAKNIQNDSHYIFDSQLIFLAIALTSPFAILFFSMARYYALFALLVSISLYMKTSPIKTWLKVAVIIAVDTLMLYTNFLGIAVVVFSHIVMFSSRANRPDGIKSLSLFFAPFVLFLPIIPALYAISTKIGSQNIFSADFGSGLNSVLIRLIYTFHVFLSGEFVFPWQISGMVIMLTGFGLLITFLRHIRKGLVYLLVGVILPSLLIIYLSTNAFSLGMEFLPSRLAFAQLGILLAVATGLSRISSMQLKSGLLLIIMLGNLHANYKMIQRENFLHSTYIIPWHQIANDISQQADPGTDMVLYDDSAFEYELIQMDSFPQSYSIQESDFNIRDLIETHPDYRIWFVFSRRDLTADNSLENILVELRYMGYTESTHLSYVKESDFALKMKKRFLNRDVEPYKKELILFEPH